MTDAEFWGLTQRLFALRYERHIAAERMRDRRAWGAAVSTARLLARQRVSARDHFPYLASEPVPLQTAEEQIAMAKTLAGVFGGRFVKVDENGEEIADE